MGKIKEWFKKFREKKDYAELTKDLKYRDRKADVWWKEAYYGIRIMWVFLTIVLLGLTLGFTYWLVKSVGEGSLDFSKYPDFLNIIAVDIVVNVLGLVAIVVRFLFPPGDKGT